MFTSVQFGLLDPAVAYQNPSFSSFPDRLMKRIKEIAISTFHRIFEFFKSFQKPSKETNLKTFAIISCLSLIALLVISMLRRRKSHTAQEPDPYP
jgi:hypothetical protein